MMAAAHPRSVDELRTLIAEAHGARAVAPPIDLSALDRIVAFSPDDLTVTVEAGVTVAALQQALASAGQWLPIDPPHPETTTVADLLQFDISGPRRFGYGTVREHVLGVAVVTGEGAIVRSGGRVVKNVAGYDLARLFIGDRRTLGVVTEVTFKLLPRPAEERILTCAVSSLGEVREQLDALVGGATTPVVLDLHTLDGHEAAPWTLVVAYAGHPDDVAWQVAQHDATWAPVERLDHEPRFWAGRTFADVVRTSVLPSALVAHLETRPPGPLVCRAGNGVVYAFDATAVGAVAPAVADAARTLAERLRQTFDPHGVFRLESTT